MSWAEIFALWLLLLGPAAGSFVTALADRACRGMPLLFARSACAECGQVIAPGDLVPLWSYVRLGGRCRSCGAAIPRAVWGGEWAGLGLAALAVWVGDGPLEQGLAALHFWLLLGLFQADARCYRLPDALTLPLLGTGLGLGSLHVGITGAALAALIGFAAFWALARGYRHWRGREGLGFGDVKLLAGLAAATGPAGIPLITLVAALSALLTAGLARLRGGPLRPDTKIAFGCHLSLAGGLVWVLTALAS